MANAYVVIVFLNRSFGRHQRKSVGVAERTRTLLMTSLKVFHPWVCRRSSSFQVPGTQKNTTFCSMVGIKGIPTLVSDVGHYQRKRELLNGWMM